MRPVGRIVSVSLLILAVLPLSSRAASLPDWAEKIVDSAPAVDVGITDQEFRILFSERYVTVAKDGVLTIRDRIAKQALSDHAGEVGIESFFVGPGAKIRRSRAWHSLPGKKTRRSGGSDAIDVSGLDSFLTDRKVRAVGIDGVREGSIVFFEFEGEWKPNVLATEYTFAHSSIVDRSRLVVELPAGWTIHESWLHSAGVPPQVAGSTYTYEFRGLSFPIEEELALDVSARAPLLYLGFEAPADVGIPHLKNWSELGLWFEELGKGSATLTPEVEAAARNAGGEEGTAQEEVILGCAKDVRDRVRYVAKSIGIGGYKPRFSGETLRSLWGDCKDKSTLLRAMLLARGVASHPVLVSVGRDDTVSEDLPVPSAFDHMVLAIDLPEGIELPGSFATATLEDEELGKLLLVDVTDEHTSIGWMSGALSGRRALIVAGDKSHLITLPGKQPEAHRRVRELLLKVAADRSMKASLTARNYGAMATWYRVQYNQSQKELREILERTVHDNWPGAQIDEFAMVREDADGAFVTRMSWSVEALPKGAGGSTVRPFPCADQVVVSTATSRRKTPVVFGNPRSVSTTVTIEGVPETSHLPPDSVKQKEGWRVERSFARDGTTVQAKWSMDLTQTRFEVTELKALKSLYRALRSIRGVMITIP